jgi:hypothetical protein
MFVVCIGKEKGDVVARVCFCTFFEELFCCDELAYMLCLGFFDRCFFIIRSETGILPSISFCRYFFTTTSNASGIFCVNSFELLLKLEHLSFPFVHHRQIWVYRFCELPNLEP